MGIFNHPEFDRHESVHYFEDPGSGLKAIIAIHSTALGPAAGGCRRWTYASEDLALTDVLRLSRGMTYKNAVAGLPFGGGKSVILAAERAPKSRALFEAFGRAVDSLNGRYITAEDVGISVDDMHTVRGSTAFVSGLPQTGTSAGGDPSPWTALGVFHGIEAAVAARLGVDSLEGITVAVQGVGHVGVYLCELLQAAGAKLVVADVNAENLRGACALVPAETVAPRDILFSDADVLAPCALGNVLNSQTIPHIRAKVVVGAANNQLATADDGARLTERGILYAPDYVVNAGGVISVAHEYLGKSTEERVRSEVCRIPERLRQIFAEAESSAQPTNVVADELARRIVAHGAPGLAINQTTAGRLIA
ncbi:MAG: amino acid dehydrogenase [Gammaproteobacteria bacterium]|nr:amino acid dehydrogenase [Gammaproteobacteria bacterium]